MTTPCSHLDDSLESRWPTGLTKSERCNRLVRCWTTPDAGPKVNSTACLAIRPGRMGARLPACKPLAGAAQIDAARGPITRCSGAWAQTAEQRSAGQRGVKTPRGRGAAKRSRAVSGPFAANERFAPRTVVRAQAMTELLGGTFKGTAGAPMQGCLPREAQAKNGVFVPFASASLRFADLYGKLAFRCSSARTSGRAYSRIGSSPRATSRRRRQPRVTNVSRSRTKFGSS